MRILVYGLESWLSWASAAVGGCWVKEADERPPCGDLLFDYEGRCYFASPTGARTPTSDPP
jgi:hypothetical protein